jgi:MinD superfamily P-loop ATPase
LVSGALHIGESSSGHLVDVVKKAAKKEAERRGADLILTDGPPGIGCPVISSIKGGDYIIAVTEPTPSALHDLKKLLEVVGYFKTPVGIVINKSDIPYGTKEAIVQFAGESDMPILSEIPYDMSIPRAMALARPVVAAYPDSSSSLALRELAYKLKDNIQKMN